MRKALLRIFWSVFFGVTLCHWAEAQSEMAAFPAPDRKHIFQEDDPKLKRATQKHVAQVLKSDKTPTKELDFKADDVQFIKEANKVKGTGNVIASREGLQLQADKALVSMETKDAEASGDVIVNYSGGILRAESANMNLDSETGDFNKAHFTLENGLYSVVADKVSKLSDTKYTLLDASFSTCDCNDDQRPWSIKTDESYITQEGYAHTYGTTLDLFGLPVLYSPYFAFPVKSERASGLLVPKYSYSNQDGIGLWLPGFFVLDDSSDLKTTPFIEARTRRGIDSEYRQAFAKDNFLSTRLLYSDESPRGESLRGTVIDDLYDPNFKENRIGWNYKHLWRGDSESSVPLTYVADVHYVNDDLFARELEEEDIIKRDARFATSAVSLRTVLGESTLIDLSSEYNQSMLTNDKLVFQRLPELAARSSRSDRPLGFNPYGIKLVSALDASATQFTRETGYDGSRADLYPNLKIPFHIQNYVSSELRAGYRDTFYRLGNEEVPGTQQLLDSSQDRRIFDIGYKMGTALEKVYQVDPEGSLNYLTSLGLDNHNLSLARVKNVIEPYTQFIYVPDVTQSDLPQFDSLDRLKQKEVFIFGLKSSLYGRFLPRNPSDEAITELTPRVQDLPPVGMSSGLMDLGDIDSSQSNLFRSRSGQIREIAYVNFKEAYDYTEDVKNIDPERSSWSDLYTDIGLNPTNDFGLRLESNYNAETHTPSSWAVSTFLDTDRGDALRARYSFLDNSISQVEGNLEVVISDRFRVGYYGRYDEREREFIDTRGALRLLSAYDCWYLDLGISRKINPDRTMAFVSFTFGGLGDITQNFGFDNRSQN